MVAMPYILVDMVLGYVSLGLFCITGAALLSRLFARRRLVFVLAASVLSFTAAILVARAFGLGILSPGVSDPLFLIGLVNSAVLLYQFLGKRYLLEAPKVRRRLLLGTLSITVPVFAAIAVVSTVIALFVIR